MRVNIKSLGKTAAISLLLILIITLAFLSSSKPKYVEVYSENTSAEYNKKTSTSVIESTYATTSSNSKDSITSINESKTSTQSVESATTHTQDNSPQLIYKASVDGYSKENYYMNASGIEEAKNNFAHTSLIEVEAGQTYYFSYYSAYSPYLAVVTYDTDKKAIKGYNPNSLKQLPNSYCYTADSFTNNNYEKECNWITIPSGISYLTFNVPKSQINNFEVYKYKWKNSFHTYKSALSSSNNLTNRSAIFYGDSIAAGQSANNEGFPEHIAGANNMKYRNYAVSGYMLNHFVNQLNSSAATLKQLTVNDYVIVEGFVNDIIGTYNPLPLGTLTENNSTEFDTSTFIGKLEKMIYDYKQAGYKGKLGFILTSKPARNENKHTEIRKYWDAAISVFKKYNVNYIDLWDNTYSYSDGLHPDISGQLAMAKDIEAWMNSF